MPKHLGSGPPNSQGFTILSPASGKPVIAAGLQADGTYAIVFNDPDTGDPLLTLGEQSDGSFGITVNNVNGNTLFRVDSVGGQSAPRAAIPMSFGGSGGPATLLTGTLPQGQGFRPGLSQTSYTPIWTAKFWSMGPYVDYSFRVFANSGNMDFRITVAESPGGPTTTVVEHTGITSNTTYTGTFTIPVACLASGSDPAGKLIYMTADAKYNSGANTVDIQLLDPPVSHA